MDENSCFKQNISVRGQEVINIHKNGMDITIRIFYVFIKLFHTVRRLIYGKEEMMWMN